MDRRYRQLSMEERSVICVGLDQGSSIRAIARMLDRSPSAVSRESACNAARQGFRRYNVALAQNMTQARRFHSPSGFKRNPHLWPQIVALLRKNFSPGQISGRLRRMYPDDPYSHVSHETIYARIYARPRGALRTELIKHPGQAHKTRRPRSRGKDRRGTWPEMTLIADRPDEVEARTVPGHREGDLIIGKQKPESAIGSIVERTSRYLILVQLDKASAPVLANSFTGQMINIPPLLRKSLTCDRGTEMARHRTIEQALDLTVYFAGPGSPWQRGTNENTNGLVRQYLPEGTDLSACTRDGLNAIAQEINERPGK